MNPLNRGAAHQETCFDCGGSGEHPWTARNKAWAGTPCPTCKGRGTRSAASWDPPPLSPEQHAVDSTSDWQERGRRQLDLAKARAPGTTVWRGEVRHADDLERPQSVGMHWTANPDQIVTQDHAPEPGHHRVIWEGVIDHPDQAFDRSHPMWSGKHRSMDSESEVRFRPGQQVRVTRRYVHDGSTDDRLFAPHKPGRSSGAWQMHEMNHPVEVQHGRGGVSDYSQFGIQHGAARPVQRWPQAKTGAMNLPGDAAFHFTPSPAQHIHHELELHARGQQLGKLSWGRDGDISGVEVHHQHRRQGIATALYTRAHELSREHRIEPPGASVFQTDAGHAFRTSFDAGERPDISHIPTHLHRGAGEHDTDLHEHLVKHHYPASADMVHSWDQETAEKAHDQISRFSPCGWGKTAAMGDDAAASDADQLKFHHEEWQSGGSLYPNEERITAHHPERGAVGSVHYLRGKRINSPILIKKLDVGKDHRRRGYGSALMDQLQAQYPKAKINHGDRTDDGKAWWKSYGQGADRRGRTGSRPFDHEAANDAWTDERARERGPGEEWRAGLPEEHQDALRRWEKHPGDVGTGAERAKFRKMISTAPPIDGPVYRGGDVKGAYGYKSKMEAAHPVGKEIKFPRWSSTSVRSEVAGGFGRVVYEIHGHNARGIGNTLHEGVMPPGKFEVHSAEWRNGPKRAPIDGRTMFNSEHLHVVLHPSARHEARLGDGRICQGCAGIGELRDGHECGACDGSGRDPDCICGRSVTKQPGEDWWSHLDGSISHDYEDQVPQNEHGPLGVADCMRMLGSSLPHQRVFGPTFGLDHRLFDGDCLRDDVTEYVLGTLGRFWEPLYGTNWRKWARVYLAGSEASEWTSETLEGNNDFDILIGIEYDDMRDDMESRPGLGTLFGMMSDEQVTNALNQQLRAGLIPHTSGEHPVTIMIDGMPTGPWDNTFFVNQDSWSIKNIKPYAAYDVTNHRWAVRPPHLPDWSISQFPEGHALVQECKAVASYVRAVLKLPEPYRAQQADALWKHLHGDRSRAFGPQGEGWFDPGNILEKFLDQKGIWEPLAKAHFDAVADPSRLLAPSDWSNDPVSVMAPPR